MPPEIFDDEIFTELFHLCAFRVFLEQAAIEQALPPDSDATRRRAYQHYEDALAAKNARRSDAA
jgi:hypothetical protein